MTDQGSWKGERRDRPPRTPRPKQHDTYARRRKPAGDEVCEECGATFHAGRWSWNPPQTDARKGLCPACERVRDRYPAGELRLPKGFVDEHDEIVGLIRNTEEMEKAEHPLERLMDIEQAADGGLTVTTTGIHLARAIANKLERRFHRQARIRYPKEEHRIEVDWEA